MKIQGKKFDGPAIEIVPIIRGEEEIILKAQAVLDYEDFHTVCPRPTPPEKMFPGGRKEVNVNDKKYIEDINGYSNKKYTWMVLKSLEATEGLEWETVDMSKPDTWDNYNKELTDSGFTEAEVVRILMAVTNAQGLNSDKIEEARKRFLASPVTESEK